LLDSVECWCERELRADWAADVRVAELLDVEASDVQVLRKWQCCSRAHACLLRSKGLAPHLHTPVVELASQGWLARPSPSQPGKGKH